MIDLKKGDTFTEIFSTEKNDLNLELTLEVEGKVKEEPLVEHMDDLDVYHGKYFCKIVSFQMGNSSMNMGKVTLSSSEDFYAVISTWKEGMIMEARLELIGRKEELVKKLKRNIFKY